MIPFRRAMRQEIRGRANRFRVWQAAMYLTDPTVEEIAEFTKLDITTVRKWVADLNLKVRRKVREDFDASPILNLPVDAFLEMMR